MNPSQLRDRYWRILFFFVGVIGSFILWEIVLPRLGLRVWTRRTRARRFRGAAVRFRALAIRMGGVMIKVGQFLSSRLDVLPPEITDELANLQDEVPAEPFPAIRALAEQEMGGSLFDKFEWLDETPLAAASLGQVHRARLRSDTPEAALFREVVIKIQRPAIEQVVAIDLSALEIVAGWLMHYGPIREHADTPALFHEFSLTVNEEIDYVREAQNAETFFDNFREDPDVHVPRVVRSLSTRHVLVLEDVYAIKITDYEAITAAGIERGAVARKLLTTYLQQIFEDGFFHADPHPGNLFVTPRPKTVDGSSNWQLTFVDFGMVGRVPEDLRAGLREVVIAVGTRDAERLIKSYKTLGFLLPSADTRAIQDASEMVFNRFWGMSMSELRSVRPDEVRDIGHRIRNVMLEMPFQVPNNLLALVRTVAILSGMCTGLDQDFNLWGQLEPYARKLVTDEAGNGLDVILDEVGELVKVLMALPSQASRVLTSIERGGLTLQSPPVERRIAGLEKAVNRLTGSVIFAALLLGGIFLSNAGNANLGNVLLVASLLVLFWTLFLARGH